MNFWIAGAALTGLTTLALVVPSLRGKPQAEFAGREQSIYLDQLREIDRDERVGLISATDAEAARTEIKRRMLRASRRTSAPGDGYPGMGKWAIFAAALAAPAVGLATYAQLGRPDVPSIPFAARADERAGAEEMEAVIGRLREKLLSDTEVRVDGWLMLAGSYMETGQPKEAAWAMETLFDRGGGQVDPELYAMYAEILVRIDDGIVSPKAEKALDTALGAQPDNVAAIYYKAIAYDQSGDAARAYEMLKARVEKETAYAPWMDAVVAFANALAAQAGKSPVVLPPAAPGPSAADVAAAGDMSAEDREVFIRSMVERLAERLAEQPDDLDGWMRLGKAYRVLGETEKSLDAFGNAERLAAKLPSDDPRRATIAKVLAEQ